MPRDKPYEVPHRSELRRCTLPSGSAAVGFAPGALAGLLVMRRIGRLGERGVTRCGACGKVLRNLTEPRCPECGRAI